MSLYSAAPGAERFADLVHRHDRESATQHERLGREPAERLRSVLFDRDEPSTARANALMLLLQRRDAGIADDLLRLFDEPDPRLWLMAIRSFCPDDPRVLDRLRLLLDDPRDEVWSEAACALARRQDEETLTRIVSWSHGGDVPRTNVATECLVRYENPEALRVLVEAWDRAGSLDAEARAVLAVALLRKGDTRGLDFLQDAARRADGATSVMASTWILQHDERLGLELMASILEHGTLAARRAMVQQIWNFARSPHAFTADGLEEARVWVQQRLQAQRLVAPGRGDAAFGLDRA
jgi:hypothetical protein